MGLLVLAKGLRRFRGTIFFHSMRPGITLVMTLGSGFDSFFPLRKSNCGCPD